MDRFSEYIMGLDQKSNQDCLFFDTIKTEFGLSAILVDYDYYANGDIAVDVWIDFDQTHTEFSHWLQEVAIKSFGGPSLTSETRYDNKTNTFAFKLVKLFKEDYNINIDSNRIDIHIHDFRWSLKSRLYGKLILQIQNSEELQKRFGLSGCRMLSGYEPSIILMFFSKNQKQYEIFLQKQQEFFNFCYDEIRKNDRFHIIKKEDVCILSYLENETEHTVWRDLLIR